MIDDDNDSHVLYRFYDRTDVLLYVGITTNPPARFKDHSKQKGWWAEVARIELSTCSSREDLRNVEFVTILFDKPRYNVVHNRNRDRVLNFEIFRDTDCWPLLVNWGLVEASDD